MAETMKVPVVTPEAAEKAATSAVAAMRESLEAVGITAAWLAQRLKRDLGRKETRTVKVRGQLIDLDAWTEEMAARMRGEAPARRRRRAKYRIIAQSAEEALVAVNFDCLDVQVRAREDAQRIHGLYVEKLALTDPEGAPVTYDSITPEERELLLAVSREYAKKIEGRHGKKGRGKD